MYSTLSTKALSQIPHLSLVMSNTKSLNRWICNGVFNSVQISGKQVDVRTNSVEFAEAVLSDADSFLNHAAEQWVALLEESKSSTHSSAWFAVTIYYFHFFTVSALLRLIGHSMSFIKKDLVSNFISLSKSKTNPGSGTYMLTAKASSNYPNESDISLKKKDSQVHDSLLRELAKVLNSINESVLNPVELELLRTLKTLPWKEDEVWHSDLRNTINYIPGYAYTACTHKNKRFSVIERFSNKSYLKVQDIAAQLIKITPKFRSQSVKDEPDIGLEIIWLRGLALFAITENILSFILKNRSVSGDNILNRNIYLKNAGLNTPQI